MPRQSTPPSASYVTTPQPWGMKATWVLERPAQPRVNRDVAPAVRLLWPQNDTRFEPPFRQTGDSLRSRQERGGAGWRRDLSSSQNPPCCRRARADSAVPPGLPPPLAAPTALAGSETA